MDHEKEALTLIDFGAMTSPLGAMTPLALGRRQVGEGFQTGALRQAGEHGRTDGREPPCRSLHTHPPRTVEFRPCRAPRSYGDGNGSLHGGVQRLGGAGRQGAGGGLGTGSEKSSMTLKRGDWLPKST